MSFRYQGSPARVVFGHGTLAQLGEEADRLGLKRLMVVSSDERRGHAERVSVALQGRAAVLFDGAVMHTPVDVTERALRMALRSEADGIVAIGGGSAIGLSKALALRTDLPQIVVPTTYAGSEATPILGETRDAEKVTQRSEKILPEVILYDVELTLGLPLPISIASGLNALAHAAEAFYAPDGSPPIDTLAEEGCIAVLGALPRIHDAPTDASARSDALYGAWLCGSCLGAVAMGLHHKLCHTLGGTFGLPHAQTHAVILPHALAYNLPASLKARSRLSRAVGADDPPRAIARLAAKLGAPLALRDIGMPEAGLERAAELATQNAYANPRPLDRDALLLLLKRAWSGEPPPPLDD
jgi:alcohol dehydrogenase class IV